MTGLHRIGIVAIGRNEGDRLKRCLASIPGTVAATVYVDSGSTDDSATHARSVGVEVVELDMDQPFTAARARNAGATRLFQVAPEVEFLQVIDGDCELEPAWLGAALERMDRQASLAVACGRRAERDRNATIYNRLTDMEWDTPIGPAEACGGDSLIRRSAFEAVEGFADDLIAGEEPEMCFRMRQRGWTVERLDVPMTLHDAAMTEFGQWWRRNFRSGHAFAESHDRHRAAQARFLSREVWSIAKWAVVVPVIALGLAWLTWGLSMLLFALYGVLWWRIRGHRLDHGDSERDASTYASYCVLGKWPQMLGVGQYYANKVLKRQSTIIEYKTSAEEQTA